MTYCCEKFIGGQDSCGPEVAEEAGGETTGDLTGLIRGLKPANQAVSAFLLVFLLRIARLGLAFAGLNSCSNSSRASPV